MTTRQPPVPSSADIGRWRTAVTRVFSPALDPASSSNAAGMRGTPPSDAGEMDTDRGGGTIDGSRKDSRDCARSDGGGGGPIGAALRGATAAGVGGAMRATL